MQIVIYFLPSDKVCDHICYRKSAGRCSGYTPNLYQVPGSDLGRLPAILISSVPPGKYRDSGLPRLGHNHFFVIKYF
jgi:hypothetical protein